MASGPGDSPPARPRPRPTPTPSITSPAGTTPANTSRPVHQAPRRVGRQLALPEPPPAGQLVASAGTAIVAAAKLGRILGRSSWRIARQLPGVVAVEREVERVRKTATARFGAPSAEEERAMLLVQDAGTDPEPLRSAMAELLERSTESDGARSRDYLFGNIVSQLVPDEARVLAALATGERYAVLDLLAKTGRTTTRPVLTNLSTVGVAARVAAPEAVGAYLDRLKGFGLVELSPAGDDLSPQFDALLADSEIQRARARVDAGKHGGRLVRKTVALSPLGREFWAACAPTNAALQRRSG